MRRATARRTAVAAAVILLTGCGKETTAPGPIDRLPRELSVAERRVVAASNEFGFGLLRQVRATEPGANTLLSPLSAAMALGMAMNGAAGTTFEQMRGTLGFGTLSREEINASYNGLLDLLDGLDTRVQLDVANATWARRGFEFLPSYFDVLRTSFDAEARELDFDAPGANDTINAWVKRQTSGRIESIIDKIESDDVLFLLNAVYFKGNWTTQFDPGKTRQGEFRRDDGSAVQVPMMRAEDMPISLGHVDGAMIGELPYGGGAYALVVALPPEGRTLAQFAAALDVAAWDAWMASLQKGEFTVQLPKLELSYEKTLNDVLKSLGMTDAFEEMRADFSRMTPEQVFISEVKQKTFLKMDEVGTEAAAVTSVGVRATSMPPSLIVDRPFVLAIRERLSGTILFIGAIGDPTE